MQNLDYDDYGDDDYYDDYYACSPEVAYSPGTAQYLYGAAGTGGTFLRVFFFNLRFRVSFSLDDILLVVLGQSCGPWQEHGWPPIWLAGKTGIIWSGLASFFFFFFYWPLVLLRIYSPCSCPRGVVGGIL